MNTENQINYLNSASYENFLTRAFKYNKKLRRPSNQEYLNLIAAESGNSYSWLPSFEKQIEEIKKRLTKAADIFIKKSKDQEQKRDLEYLKIKISHMVSYNDIPTIVKRGLEITQNFK